MIVRCACVPGTPRLCLTKSRIGQPLNFHELLRATADFPPVCRWVRDATRLLLFPSPLERPGHRDGHGALAERELVPVGGVARALRLVAHVHRDAAHARACVPRSLLRRCCGFKFRSQEPLCVTIALFATASSPSLPLMPQSCDKIQRGLRTSFWKRRAVKLGHLKNSNLENALCRISL